MEAEVATTFGFQGTTIAHNSFRPTLESFSGQDDGASLLRGTACG